MTRGNSSKYLLPSTKLTSKEMEVVRLTCEECMDMAYVKRGFTNVMELMRWHLAGGVELQSLQQRIDDLEKKCEYWKKACTMGDLFIASNRK